MWVCGADSPQAPFHPQLKSEVSAPLRSGQSPLCVLMAMSQIDPKATLANRSVNQDAC